jgi:hypothetical protein
MYINKKMMSLKELKRFIVNYVIIYYYLCTLNWIG